MLVHLRNDCSGQSLAVKPGIWNSSRTLPWAQRHKDLGHLPPLSTLAGSGIGSRAVGTYEILA